jgi:thiol-disulfide isomerase/thioredoxin
MIGDQIANLAFLYLPNGMEDANKAPVKGSMADFYAKRKEGAKLLILSGAAVWCGPCNKEAEEYRELLKDAAFLAYLNQKGGRQALQLIQVVLQDLKGNPATENDMKNWATSHKSNYGVGYDPMDQFRPYTPVNALPRNLYIRLDNMKIMFQDPGAPATLEGLKAQVKKYLDQL